MKTVIKTMLAVMLLALLVTLTGCYGNNHRERHDNDRHSDYRGR